MPLSVRLAPTTGFPAIFAAGGLVALVALAVLPGLPSRVVAGGQRLGATPELGVEAALRLPCMMRPAILFTAVAMTAGVIAAFLPAAVPDGSGNLAVAVLVHAATATASRWWAGRFGDRHGAATLMVPGTLLVAAGTATLVMSWSPAAVLTGASLLGTGFGAVQNASLATMYDRVDTSSYGSVTAVWSVAYDSGLGAGAVGGLLASIAGYGTGFAVMAVVVVAALGAIRGTQATKGSIR